MKIWGIKCKKNKCKRWEAEKGLICYRGTKETSMAKSLGVMGEGGLEKWTS